MYFVLLQLLTDTQHYRFSHNWVTYTENKLNIK